MPNPATTPTSTEDALAIARSFVDAFNAGDTARIGALFHADGEFHFPRSAPVRGADAVGGFFKMAGEKFFKKMALTPRDTFGSGGRVLMQWTNESPTHFGWTYRNRGAFVFTIEDGKIRTLEEYLDTLQVVPLFKEAGLGDF